MISDPNKNIINHFCTQNKMNIEPLLMNPKGSNCFYVNSLYEIPE